MDRGTNGEIDGRSDKGKDRWKDIQLERWTDGRIDV